MHPNKTISVPMVGGLRSALALMLDEKIKALVLLKKERDGRSQSLARVTAACDALEVEVAEIERAIEATGGKKERSI